MAQGQVPARTWAEVDLEAIGHNLREIKKLLRPGVRVMAVVKADGYGHGALEVARAALGEGASFLGVATVEEGIKLRKAGLTSPILVLSSCPPEQADLIMAHDLTPAVFSPAQAEALAREAFNRGRKVKVHLKVDTGMGRLGLRGPEEAAAFCRRISSWPLEIEGIFTHFACAEEPSKEKSSRQLEGFREVLKRLEEEGVCPPLRHAANSAAALEFPPAHLDMVRIGISLYGYHPRGKGAGGPDLRPALSWKAKITQVKRLPPGSPLSYGWTYTTSAEEIIATVPVGYADGYRRALSNRGWVLVRGKRAPVVGRVCMDQLMIRLDEEVAPGTQVTLLGCEGEESITADDLASWVDTISYEVLTSIGPRVPRIYRHGEVAPNG
ncbi:alanine racemase [Desulfovirgula thermocuniculi]|uniref:alanine racemase n=1 Tax=Desulfovirgula thermocuniculi TaxID=348842 RepID=UPI00040F234D|nr:alanine racemase [Desulfovirgula thermocuniculi]